MAFYVLYAKDKPNSLEQRLEHYAAHRAFIEAQNGTDGVSVVMSGPLQTDEGETMIGSVLILEAQTRAAVDQFVAADPFTRAGIWGEVHISRFYPRRTPGRSLPPLEN